MRLNDTTRAYFERMAEISAPDRAVIYKSLLDPKTALNYVSRGVGNEAEMQVQAPVWIIDPQEGATVGSTFTVDGRGAFFEANVSWQLLQGDRVVKHGFTTAAQGMTLSPYSFTVRDVPSGDYTIRVYDADMSGEGHAEQQDTKDLTVH